MFDALRSTPTSEGFNTHVFYERLAEILVEAGLRPDDRLFFSLHKMISDDVSWYLEMLEAVVNEPAGSAS